MSWRSDWTAGSGQWGTPWLLKSPFFGGGRYGDPGTEMRGRSYCLSEGGAACTYNLSMRAKHGGVERRGSNLRSSVQYLLPCLLPRRYLHRSSSKMPSLNSLRINARLLASCSSIYTYSKHVERNSRNPLLSFNSSTAPKGLSLTQLAAAS